MGGFRITRDGQPVAGASTVRLQSLIAYLTLHAETPVSRQQLAFLFWTDSREAQARTNLRQLLHHLRAALPESDRCLETDGQNICWRTLPDWELDSAAFERTAADAQDYAAIEQAALLYKGDLIPGSYDDWLEPHRERLKTVYHRLLDRMITLAADAGDLDAAILHAERRLARDPLREAGYQTLIRLHASKGDRAGALAVYQRCAETLKRELGLEPGHATRRCRDQVRDQGDAAPAERPATQRPPSAAAEIPLVGRDAEWSSLLATWRQAAAGKTSLVILTGEAGIGKTRLLEELRDRVAREGDSTARASCYSSSQALAYTAAGGWLRSAAIRPHVQEMSAVERAQLARVLPEILAEQADVEAPRPFTETWQRRHFFEAMARAVLRAKQPLLLSVDDLQWCDPETLEWLQYLVRFDASARLMIVATARLEELSPDHPVAIAARELTRGEWAIEIGLGPLDEQDTLRLARQISVGSLSLEEAETLYPQTRGNPLFVVETVRARPVSKGHIAPKLQAVISARLAHLGEPTRQIAAVGSAIGRPFSMELAAKVAGLAEDVAVQAVDELWRHKILRQEEGDCYDFVHGCLRDAAYADVGPARRKQLHRLLAEALESLDIARSHESANQIASHYEQAGLALRAIPWYQRAAALVRRRYAEDEAIAFLNTALRLLAAQPPSTERDRVELDLLISLGPSLSATQGFASEDAGRIYSRARLLCEVLGETDRYVTVLGGSWTFHIVRGELEIAREIAQRYMALAERRDDCLLRAAGSFCMGSTSYFGGALRESRQQLEASNGYGAQSPAAFLELGPELGVFCRGHLTHALWLLGEPDAANAECVRNLARAEGLSHPFSVALALAYAASLHQFRDEPEAAQARAEAAAALCRKYGFRYYLAWTPIIIGWACARMGDRDRGLEQMQSGFAALRATGASLRSPYYKGLIAQVAGWCGDAEAGLLHLKEAQNLGERSQENWVRPELQRIHGDLLLQSGQIREAETSYLSAARLARQIGAKAWESRAEVSLKNIRK